MDYRYPAGAVRRLDDALLAVFGTRYLGVQGNAHRVALLRTRLERLRAPSSRIGHEAGTSGKPVTASLSPCRRGSDEPFGADTSG